MDWGIKMKDRHDNTPIKVDVNGCVFRSIRAAAAACGVSGSTVSRQRNDNRIRQQAGGYINGVFFPTKKAAAKTFGINQWTFLNHINAGKIEWQDRDRYAEVVEKYKDGIAPGEIAKSLNLPADIVYAEGVKARRNGDLPKRGSYAIRTSGKAAYKLLAYRCSREGRRVGSLIDVVNPLTPDVVKWLADITVEGMSIAETITSIINDAYAEENK